MFFVRALIGCVILNFVSHSVIGKMPEEVDMV